MLGQFIVKVANLAEAEGRVAKQSVFLLAAAVLVFAAAVALVLVALVLLGVAMYLGLAEVMPPGGAAALVGAILLLVGLVAAMSAGRIIHKRVSR